MPYAASKHAAEGMVDALRRELMAEGAPISVTSIKPGTINTPFFNNSRNKVDVKPQGPPPFYQPDVVADCILYAAERPVRDLFAGGGGKVMALSQMGTPGLVDATLARFGITLERTKEPRPGGGLARQPVRPPHRGQPGGGRLQPEDPAPERLHLAGDTSGGAAARHGPTGGALAGTALLLRRGTRPARPGWSGEDGA